MLPITVVVLTPNLKLAYHFASAATSPNTKPKAANHIRPSQFGTMGLNRQLAHRKSTRLPRKPTTKQKNDTPPKITRSSVGMPSLSVVFLVELTGIEPVASWLQTRRSPS